MVEQAATQKSLIPPAWVREILPLYPLYFAGERRSLRHYLLACVAGPPQAPQSRHRCHHRRSRLMPRASSLTTADMLRLFDLLNDELVLTDTQAEINLVGGDVMCLAFGARGDA